MPGSVLFYKKYQELTPLNIEKVRISIKLNAENWLKTKAYLNNYNLNRALKNDIYPYVYVYSTCG